MTSNLKHLTVLPSPAGIKVICSQEQPFPSEDCSEAYEVKGAFLDDNSQQEDIKVASTKENTDSYLFWNDHHHHHRVLTYVCDWKEAESSLYDGSWVAASNKEHEYWGI